MDRHSPIPCVVLAWVVALLFPVPAADAQDTVYVFSDGSINRVEGTIVQEVAGENLLIRTIDGQEIEVAAGDVANIIRGGSVMGRSQPDYPIGDPKVSDIVDPLESTSPKVSPKALPVGYRDPGIAFLLSFLIPGGGQFYNGDAASGFLFLGGAVVGGALVAHADPLSSTFDRDVLVGGSVLFFSSITSLIMAPMEASRLNRANGFHTQANVSSRGAIITLAFDF